MNDLRIFIESNPLSRHTVIGSSCFRQTKSECQKLKPTGRFQDTRNVPQFSMIFLDRFFLALKPGNAPETQGAFCFFLKQNAIDAYL